MDFHMTSETDSFYSAVTWERSPPRLHIENAVKLYKHIESILCWPAARCSHKDKPSKKNWHRRVCQRTPASTKHHSYCRSLLKNPFHFKGTLVWRHVCTAEEEIPARKQEYRKITPMIDQHSLNSFNESLLRNRKCALHTTWGDEVIKCGSGGPHQFSNRPEMIEMLEVPWQLIHARHM